MIKSGDAAKQFLHLLVSDFQDRRTIASAQFAFGPPKVVTHPSARSVLLEPRTMTRTAAQRSVDRAAAHWPRDHLLSKGGAGLGPFQ